MRYQPSLQTERLRLRPFVSDDAETIARLVGASDIAATTISIPHSYSLSAAKTWIASLPHLYRTGSAVHFAVCLLESKELIGSFALREINVKYANAELEFWIGHDWQRQGYALEALQEIVQFAFSQLELHRIYACYLATDQVSAQFLTKQGFVQEGILRDAVLGEGGYQDVAMAAVIAEE